MSQSWESVANFPFTGVHHPVTFSYGDDAYVVTGSNTDNVYKYNSLTDSWTQLNSFPGGVRGYAYGVAVNDKAYISGVATSELEMNLVKTHASSARFIKEVYNYIILNKDTR